MYRVLLSRQWVMLTLVSLLLIPAFIKAGNWQYDRYGQRVERNELIKGNLEAEPVPMTELAAPGRAPDPDDRYRTVTASGSYDAAGEVVVRQRTGNQDGALGYYVLTPLTQDDGPVVLVNRGWVRAGSDPTRMPDVPAPPDGEVTVSGRLMADETPETTGIRDRGGLPEGMVMMMNSGQRAEELGTPVVAGHLELAETTPAPAGGPEDQPELLSAPNHSGIGAHFAYAYQWWLFAAMVPVGWVLLLRRELADAREEGPGEAPSTAGGPDGPDDRTGTTDGHPTEADTGTASADVADTDTDTDETRSSDATAGEAPAVR
ncbi:SURF1 family cytochrome oxidase biogenesis protein [Streptomyces otsuchiensis]|uniref:SURF1 family cytochrome oxidase biogenesis protein n=1 Tax=Streptomyces otsuchiensis TaxID=2681388 RepID=UPI00102F87E5|nr:SURF1 family protein [Streptomyces otsuchiensis]